MLVYEKQINKNNISQGSEIKRLITTTLLEENKETSLVQLISLESLWCHCHLGSHFLETICLVLKYIHAYKHGFLFLNHMK